MTFNAAECVNGVVLQNADGTEAAYANSIASGFVPIRPGHPLTIKIPTSETLGGGGIGGTYKGMYLYDADRAYLGQNRFISGNPTVPNVDVVWNQVLGAYYVTTVNARDERVAYVRFQIPGSYIVHTTEDFNRVVALITAEGNDPPSSIAVEKTSGALILHDHTAYGDDRYLQRPLTPRGAVLAFDPTAGRAYETGLSVDDLCSGRRNLFDPELAEDGAVLSFLLGLRQAYANNMISPSIPVEPGRTYVYSTPWGEIGGGLPGQTVWFYDAAGAYLGIDHLVGENPMAEHQTVTGGLTALGRRYVRVELPAATAIRYMRFSLTGDYTAHTAADFDRIRRAIQVEEAFDPTDFVPYETLVSPMLRSTVLPRLYQVGKVRVIKAGDVVAIRVAWNDTHDLVHKIDLGRDGIAWNNNPVEFTSTGLVAVETADSEVPAGAYSTALHTSGDDICPININGTYIGANHGGSVLVELTVASHDKTVQDVGSEWTDTLGRKWYLMRVVSETKLWVMSENTSLTDVWAFYGSVTGSPLTHSAGATHTASIAISSQLLTQLWPGIKDQVRGLYEDGTSEILDDGTYVCDHLDVVHTYEIMDLPSVLAYVRSCVGGSVQPTFDHASVANAVRVAITYRFSVNGSVTIHQTVTPHQDVRLGYMGFLQAAGLTVPAGGTLWEYIPRADSFIIGGNSYNFAAIQEITTLLDAVEFTTGRWSDPLYPPDRFVQFTRDAGAARVYGIEVGYCQVGLGAPATRVNNVDSACLLNTTKKQYPKGVSAGGSAWVGDIVPADTVLNMIAFRCPLDFASNPSPTAVAWYYVGDVVYLMADFHALFSGYLSVPRAFVGRRITAVEVEGSLVLGSGFVETDGVPVTVSSPYATMVVTLTR
jgi:hypothetical protein